MVNKPHYSTALVIHESGQEVPQWMLKLDKPLKKQKKMLATKQPDRGHLSQAVLHEELERKKKRLGNFLSVFLTTLCFIELNIILVRLCCLYSLIWRTIIWLYTCLVLHQANESEEESREEERKTRGAATQGRWWRNSNSSNTSTHTKEEEKEETSRDTRIGQLNSYCMCLSIPDSGHLNFPTS